MLDTLNNLAESQAAVSAGQTADKQKSLAKKIIEGKRQIDEEKIKYSEKSNKKAIRKGLLKICPKKN